MTDGSSHQYTTHRVRRKEAMSLFGLGRNQQTFRPKNSTPSRSKLRKHIEGSGNLREAVRLPPGEDLIEWLAVNTVDFFNQTNLLYGTLTEFCTAENCPTMTVGPNFCIYVMGEDNLLLQAGVF